MPDVENNTLYCIAYGLNPGIGHSLLARVKSYRTYGSLMLEDSYGFYMRREHESFSRLIRSHIFHLNPKGFVKNEFRRSKYADLYCRFFSVDKDTYDKFMHIIEKDRDIDLENKEQPRKTHYVAAQKYGLVFGGYSKRYGGPKFNTRTANCHHYACNVLAKLGIIDDYLFSKSSPGDFEDCLTMAGHLKGFDQVSLRQRGDGYHFLNKRINQITLNKGGSPKCSSHFDSISKKLLSSLTSHLPYLKNNNIYKLYCRWDSITRNRFLFKLSNLLYTNYLTKSTQFLRNHHHQELIRSILLPEINKMDFQAGCSSTRFFDCFDSLIIKHFPSFANIHGHFFSILIFLKSFKMSAHE